MRKIEYFFVVFFIFFIYSIGIVEAKNESPFDRALKKKQKTCDKEICKRHIENYNENCINQCTHVECFNKIYGTDPLEDGEVDNKRYKFHRFNITRDI